MDLPRCFTFILLTGSITIGLPGCQATHSSNTQTSTTDVYEQVTLADTGANTVVYDSTFLTYDRPKLVPGKPGEIILSAVFNSHDWATGKDVNTIIPIMRYAGGMYEGFSDYTDFDDSIDFSKSEVKPFLDRYKKHTIWLDGNQAGTITIDSLKGEMVACFKLVVGKSYDRISEKDIKTVLRKYGYADNLITDSSQSSAMMLATANMPKAKAVKQIKADIPEVILNSLRTKMINQLQEQEAYVLIPDSIKVFQKTALDIDGDGILETFVSLFYEDSIRQAGYTFGFHMKDQQADTFFANGSYLEYGSWGTGLTFLEALDINGDKMPELIFEDDGYESTDFLIFEYREGQLKQVFSGGGWGC